MCKVFVVLGPVGECQSAVQTNPGHVMGKTSPVAAEIAEEHGFQDGFNLVLEFKSPVHCRGRGHRLRIPCRVGRGAPTLRYDRPAASAAALPPDDPPGVRVRSHGSVITSKA
jgi:hypothetical protein